MISLLLLLGQSSGACPPGTSTTIMRGLDLGPPVLSKFTSTSWEDCCGLCSLESKCVAWTYFHLGICVLRDKIGIEFALQQQDKSRDLVISGILKPVIVSSAQPPKDFLIYVGILSAPDHFAKRKKIREECIPRFLRQSPDYRVKYEFVIGHSIKKEEVDLPKKLWKEQEQFDDIFFMAYEDLYLDLPTKTLELVKRGVQHGDNYIVKMDDDMCLNLKRFMHVVKTANSPKYGYFGKGIWDKQVYKGQKGADGKFVKYMAGPLYVLTLDLARLIVVDDMNYAAMFPMYGSSSEDIDMGRWVKHAKDKHNVDVKYVVGNIGDDMK